MGGPGSVVQSPGHGWGRHGATEDGGWVAWEDTATVPVAPTCPAAGEWHRPGTTATNLPTRPSITPQTTLALSMALPPHTPTARPPSPPPAPGRSHRWAQPVCKPLFPMAARCGWCPWQGTVGGRGPGRRQEQGWHQPQDGAAQAPGAPPLNIAPCRAGCPRQRPRPRSTAGPPARPHTRAGGPRGQS